MQETRKGRIINALLAFLTANRYSIIFQLKITMVKRNYQESRLKERILDNLLISLVLFPFLMGNVFYMERCTPKLPHTTPSTLDTIRKQPDKESTKFDPLEMGLIIERLDGCAVGHVDVTNNR